MAERDGTDVVGDDGALAGISASDLLRAATTVFTVDKSSNLHKKVRRMRKHKGHGVCVCCPGELVLSLATCLPPCGRIESSSGPVSS